jgi:hypothetical protein
MKPVPIPSLQARLSPADEKLGMAWWQALSRGERSGVLQATEARLARDVSVADAWLVWQRRNGAAGQN